MWLQAKRSKEVHHNSKQKLWDLKYTLNLSDI